MLSTHVSAVIGSAEDLFIGWLDAPGHDCSWRVVAGQNAAYDQFPCQYQVSGSAFGLRGPATHICAAVCASQQATLL